MKGVVVIGCGNDDRGDDAAGLEAVRALVAADPPGHVRAVLDGGDPMGLIEVWDGSAVLYVVDAVASDGPPGQVQRFEVRDPAAPRAQELASSHGFDALDAVALARVLDRLPGRVVVFGITGSCFDPGTGPSAPVTRAAQEVAARILEEVQG